MGSQVVAIRMLQSVLSIVENDALVRSCILIATNPKLNSSSEPGFCGQASNMRVKSASLSESRFQTKTNSWRLSFALNPSGLSNNGGGENLNGENPDLGSTRLGRIVSSGAKQLLQKLNSARKNFPMKIFLLLLGFYTANALATILGQTGDWDVLVAGIVVAAIEGIGMVMYRRRRRPMANTGRFRSFVEMINYWKAGVCLGLFVDAFKLGS